VLVEALAWTVVVEVALVGEYRFVPRLRRHWMRKPQEVEPVAHVHDRGLGR